MAQWLHGQLSRWGKTQILRNLGWMYKASAWKNSHALLVGWNCFKMWTKSVSRMAVTLDPRHDQTWMKKPSKRIRNSYAARSEIRASLMPSPRLDPRSWKTSKSGAGHHDPSSASSYCSFFQKLTTSWGSCVICVVVDSISLHRQKAHTSKLAFWCFLYPCLITGTYGSGLDHQKSAKKLETLMGKSVNINIININQL